MVSLEHPLELSGLGPIPGWVWLALVWAVGAGFFCYQLFTVYKLIKLGQPDERFKDWGWRLRTFLINVLFQRKVLRDRVAGTLHVLIFWGFLALASDILDLSTGGAFEGWLAGLSQGLANLWNVMVDLGYLMALIGASAALLRRVALRPEKLKPSFEGNLILVLILTIVITAFLLEGALEAANDAQPAWVEPVGGLFATALSGFSLGALKGLALAAFWLHMACLSSFLVLIPRSKHLHLIGAPLSVAFSDKAPRGQMVPLDLEAEMEREEPKLGVVKASDYRWKALLDSFACTDCARCQEACPAHASGKVLNPMQLVHDLRDNLLTLQPRVIKGPRLLVPSGSTTGQAEAEKLVEVYTPEALWACTTCFACVEACPVYIEHVPKITDVRRSLVMMEAEFPAELATVFTNLERQSNPWGVGAHQRAEWAEGLEVDTAAAKGEFEVLYYVGCAGAFDERNKTVARAVVKLLQAAGVDFAILGSEEGCCGDPARRAGNEYLFWELAQTNVEQFKAHKVSKVVTACPHCYHTLAREYPNYGWSGEVVHHSVYLQELLAEGRLKVDPATLGQVTFHDPCYLGRINDVVEEPRQVLETAGAGLVEMERSRKKSFCCGGGGGRFWMEEEPDQRVNSLRVKEALATGAPTVAVGCPYCMTMLEDGVKESGAEENVKVMDLAELLVRNLAHQSTS